MIKGKMTFGTMIQLIIIGIGVIMFFAVDILTGALIGFIIGVFQTIMGLVHLARLSRYPHKIARMVEIYWGGYILFFLSLASNDFTLASTGTPYWLKVIFFLVPLSLALLMALITYALAAAKIRPRGFTQQQILDEESVER